MQGYMVIPGNLLTTAMAVMPHTNVERALETALSLDVPFWPQLPNYSYYAEVFSAYASSIRRFLEKGGVIVWGIVPTGIDIFGGETVDSLIARLEALWNFLGQKGIDMEELLHNSILSPATCCLVNPDKEKTVESAFESTRTISHRLREKYRLG